MLLCALLVAGALNGIHAQEGAWKGDLNIQGIKLPLVFHFDSKGCTVDSPAQGVNGLPAEKGTDGADTVTVTVAPIGATFKGRKDGNRIEGTFTQNGMTLPLVLTPGTHTVNRPQTPAGPFPYTEEEVSFTHAGYTFHGTLVLPPHCTRATPAVLMVTGSGQQNRNEEMFGHKPFAVIADALARKGIASLRYDDRGWNDKSIDFDRFTTADFKEDAGAALAFLRKRFSKAGILGHSEGGTIALMLAAEGKADFVVSLAGMAVSGKQTLVMQNRTAMAAVGVAGDMLDSYCQAVSQALDMLASGKKASEIPTGNVPPALKPVLEKALQQADTPYIRHFITVDASRLLGRIKCPVLALGGTKDQQVDAAANLGALEKGLTHCSHTVRTVDGVNHLFQHCATGSIVEYEQTEETFAPEAIDTVVQWIQQLPDIDKKHQK